MVDPDAPSRANPNLRDYLHWLVVNIPGKQISCGYTSASYIGPGPPEGTATLISFEIKHTYFRHRPLFEKYHRSRYDIRSTQQSGKTVGLHINRMKTQFMKNPWCEGKQIELDGDSD
ncbi:hypothetical protein KIN20_028760 [Parelaphostrongylus tenuis]|uniref:Uncharacterized protein n=1 Tax=Parelaphostrongylus tenuis TaxID=148309 RepID=A0AAD5R1F8_PARTN|nr:hypothetical protein KIN20_028760 [Parelaphostrongylus tenuis]